MMICLLYHRMNEIARAEQASEDRKTPETGERLPFSGGLRYDNRNGRKKTAEEGEIS